MEKLFCLLIFSILCQAFADSGICLNDCGKSFGVMELSSACTKGCNYFGELAQLLRTSDSDVRDNCEKGCNHRYEKDDIFQACNQGCATKHDQKKKAEVEVEEPPRRMFLVVIRRYIFGENSQEGVRRVGLIKFNVEPQNFHEEMLRSPDAIIEERGQNLDVSSVEMTSNPNLFDLIIPMCSAALVLITLAYLIVIFRHRYLAKMKAVNLAVAVQHEPIKLVLPEDLTKLSLIDDDEAPPLPHKQPLPKTSV